MADDYYKTLGVARDASAEAIGKAYRKLARKHHPDVNPDDKTAKKKFQEIQHAYDVLNDPKKRELYDRFGPGFEQAGAGASPGGGGWPGAGGMPPGAENVDFSQIFGAGAGGFGDFFSQFTRGAQGRPGNGRRRRTMHELERGADVEAEVEIPFTVAILGGKQALTLNRGGQAETITVTIPQGIEEGKKIRLRGQGQPGPVAGTDPGDLLVTIRVGSHPFFSRKGDHLYVKLPVTLREAAEGAKVDVPTPQGTVSLRVPPGTSSGAKLRVRGHGVHAKGKSEPGDLYAEVQIVMPPQLTEHDLEWIRKLDERHPTTPREKLKW
ncbi:MAG: J domain-containing protein [Planctomycetaceae bacterium]|nr:J domain-containing protein [Planctomycetaceae bacterium]